MAAEIRFVANTSEVQTLTNALTPEKPVNIANTKKSVQSFFKLGSGKMRNLTRFVSSETVLASISTTPDRWRLIFVSL
jgi:hypothetical protein